MSDEVKQDTSEETKVTAEKEVKETKEENKKEKKDKFQKEIEKLENELKKAHKEADEWKDKYYRAYADMDNQRKQYSKEYQQALKYASQNLSEKLIPSVEMFSTVVESSENLPQEVKAYVMGFDMVYRQMMQAFESEGVSEIKVAIGDKFDHTIHYAMEAQEVEDTSLVDKVIKVCRKGYKLYDRLLKPVTVIVGKAKAATKEEPVEEKAQEEK